MVQSRQTMNPGHPEPNLLGIASLALPEMPETWQHAVNHWLDVALAFSGLSLGLGYGVLFLALPLLLLPTAFPELSRPRDALWSLLLAALAPVLLLNRLPVFSSAGLGELMATVLMVRLAVEVGQGRWESLTPDQRSALRHLPRWRRAGADLVTAVVQAVKDAWSEVVQAGKAVQDGGASSGIPDVPPAAEASPDRAADRSLAAEPPQPGDGDAQANGEEAATGGNGEITPEQEHRAGTGWIAAVVQAPKAAWGAVFGQKGPGEQRRQGWSARKPARKEWVRPGPSAGAQDHQDGGTRPGIPDEDATPEPEHPDKPTADGPVRAVVEDTTPEEHSAPQPVDLAEVPEPAQSSEGSADAVVPEPEPRESVVEELGAPEPVAPAEGAQPAQPLDGDEAEDAKANEEEAATGAGEGATPEPEHPDKPTADGPVRAVVEDTTPEEHSAPQPVDLAEVPEPAQSSEGDADAVVPEPEPRESVVEEPGAPEPVAPAEGAQPAQPLDGDEAEDAKANEEEAATGAGEGTTPEPERPDKPTADGPVTAVVEDTTPEEHTAPQPVEQAQQAQPVDGDDPEDDKGADIAPEAPEAVEDLAEAPEPAAQSSEGSADAVVPEPAPKEGADEDSSSPEPVEPAEGAQPAQPLDGDGAEDAKANGEEVATGAGEDATPEPEDSDKPTVDEPVTAAVEDTTPEDHTAPQPVDEPQQVQPVDGDHLEDDKGADAAPEAPEEPVESPVEPPAEPAAQSSEEVGTYAVVPEPEPRENAAEESSAPELAEETEVDAVPEGDPGNPVGNGSTQPAQEGKDVVVDGFDEVDEKLRGSN